jgi:hypothetical protein
MKWSSQFNFFCFHDIISGTTLHCVEYVVWKTCMLQMEREVGMKVVVAYCEALKC